MLRRMSQIYKNKMVVSIQGYQVEVFTIGYAAKTLRISTETIRSWERMGIMPKAMFTYKNGVRLYHPLEIEAIAKVLRKKHFRGTFKKQEKLKQELWKELAAARKEVLASLQPNEETPEEKLQTEV